MRTFTAGVNRPLISRYRMPRPLSAAEYGRSITKNNVTQINKITFDNVIYKIGCRDNTLKRVNSYSIL